MKIKQSLLVFATTLLAHISFSQDRERLWENGNLTWEDFKDNPYSYHPNETELNYMLSYANGKEQIGDTLIFSFKTKNSINPYLCWTKIKNEQNLKYNQVIFNIVELHRRHLQWQLNRVNNYYLPEEKLRTQYEKLNYQIKSFQEHSLLGADSTIINQWDEKIRKDLKENPLEIIPSYTADKFGFGGYIGMGSNVLNGDLSNHFSNTVSFNFGAEIAYKNIFLLTSFNFGHNKVKQQFSNREDHIWNEKLKTNLSTVDLSLGYSVINNQKHKVTPFIGIAGSSIGVKEGEGEDYKDHLLSLSDFIYGMNYEFKRRTLIDLLPRLSFNNQSHRSERMYRARLSVQPTNNSNLSGSVISFSLGWSVFVNNITLK